jgi:hypothetical protein
MFRRRPWTVVAELPRASSPGYRYELRSKHWSYKAATRRAQYERPLSDNACAELHVMPRRFADDLPGVTR